MWTNILGVKVSAINLLIAQENIKKWIETGTKRYVCVTGVHGIMESQRDSRLQDIHNQAGMVTPDGVPLVWLSLLARQPKVSRVYGPDLMSQVFEMSVKSGWRHFLYGTTPDTLAILISRLNDRFPGVNIVGSHSPPFRPLTSQEDDDEVAMINASKADIVWVGLGTPKQEHWMATHRARINTPVMVGVGAAFNMHAGLLPQAPRILQVAGLEWAFRLAVEPMRLAPRYLKNNPMFLISIARQAISPQKYYISE
jgi:N-acetylglucosaminyldiphosphoundecaprenol N-acetyl-beta-D-mannosaminyltransferase